MPASEVNQVVAAIGWLGAAVFYGRFYVQWIVSEIKRRSVVPVAFWYMSGAGSVLLLIYNVITCQPGAAFGQSFNMVVYTRNLIHIWREKGKLTPALSKGAHVTAAVVVLVAMALTGYTWMQEYVHNSALAPDEAARNWFWLGIWGAGQAFFFLRFAIQWAVTEYKRKSVIPTVFWHLSIVAALLQGASFVQRADWVNAVGMAATILVYARNAWMIQRSGAAAQGTPAA